jgi:phosphatidylserine decarboxylase
MMDKFSLPESPSRFAFPVASAGYPLIFASAFATGVLALLQLRVPALLGLAVTFFIAYFFRDPDRVVPVSDGAVISPADGRVVIAGKVDHTLFYDGPCQKVSIFMSVFNVHVNRIPHDGQVEKIEYHPGKFVNASLDKASEDNERNAVFMITDRGQRFCVVQIAGLIARRIICHIQAGDTVHRGRRFGMICFGSRLDVYLPLETTLNVAVGDRVKAGTSIVGYLG